MWFIKELHVLKWCSHFLIDSAFKFSWHVETRPISVASSEDCSQTHAETLLLPYYHILVCNHLEYRHGVACQIDATQMQLLERRENNGNSHFCAEQNTLSFVLLMVVCKEGKTQEGSQTQGCCLCRFKNLFAIAEVYSYVFFRSQQLILIFSD